MANLLVGIERPKVLKLIAWRMFFLVRNKKIEP